jgi:hypothetical protein
MPERFSGLRCWIGASVAVSRNGPFILERLKENDLRRHGDTAVSAAQPRPPLGPPSPSAVFCAVVLAFVPGETGKRSWSAHPQVDGKDASADWQPVFAGSQQPRLPSSPGLSLTPTRAFRALMTTEVRHQWIRRGARAKSSIVGRAGLMWASAGSAGSKYELLFCRAAQSAPGPGLNSAGPDAAGLGV